MFVVAVLSLLSGRAVQAQVKPFKISGGGVGPSGLPLPGQPAREHWANGEATHLGRYYGKGTLRNDFINLTDAANGRITGLFGSDEPFIFIAANGDRLACYYGRVDKGAQAPGSYVLTILDVDTSTNQFLVNAEWIAEFVVQPEKSTGRFAGATGSWIMYAKSVKPFLVPSTDPVYYVWQGEGRLTFPKPR
jgi:hypothetical protein